MKEAQITTGLILEMYIDRAMEERVQHCSAHSSPGYKPPVPETITLDKRKTENVEDREVLIH